VNPNPVFKELFRSLGEPGIALAMLLIIAVSYGFGMLEPLVPLHLSREFNLDSRGIGFFFGVFSLTYAIVQPLWGFASDKIGYRPVIITGLAGSLLAAPALALAPGLFYVYIAGGLFSIANSAIMTPCLPMLAEYSEKSGGESYGRSFGMMNAAYSIGLLLGPALGGLVAREFSFLGAAVVYSLLLLPIGAGVVRIKHPLAQKPFVENKKAP
jgi:MFS family permease